MQKWTEDAPASYYAMNPLDSEEFTEHEEYLENDVAAKDNNGNSPNGATNKRLPRQNQIGRPKCSKEMSMRFSDLNGSDHGCKPTHKFDRSNNDSSMSFGNWSMSDSQPWKCVSCTYVNSNPLFLTCEMCGQGRPSLKEEDLNELENLDGDEFEQRKSQIEEAQTNLLLQSRFKEIQKMQVRAMSNVLEEERSHGEGDSFGEELYDQEDNNDNNNNNNNNEADVLAPDFQGLQIDTRQRAFHADNNNDGIDQISALADFEDLEFDPNPYSKHASIALDIPVSDASLHNIYQSRFDELKRQSMGGNHNNNDNERETEDQVISTNIADQHEFSLDDEEFVLEQQRLMEQFSKNRRGTC